MQSFCGSVRLVRRQTINSSKIFDFRSTKAFPLTSGSGLGSFEPNTSVSNGVCAVKFIGTSIDYSKDYLFRLLPKFTSHSPMASQTKSGTQTDLLTSSNNGGISSVAPLYRGPTPGLFHQSAAVPTLPGRCITTMGDSIKSVVQDASASVSDVAPRIKFKRPDKTARHIMQILDKEAVQEVRKQREIPDIKPGYIIQLKVEVPENKRRVSIVKGIVIARRNAGLNTTFRLRRLVAGVGVESLFLLYSPTIKEIKVLDKKKVRRAKLYYLRDKMNALKKH
uniref:Ribosomal protein L19 family protein n=1 Tax=Davidia involucrata TaxID=16924 RepID=A0A5B6ZCX0_DAVIN